MNDLSKWESAFRKSFSITEQAFTYNNLTLTIKRSLAPQPDTAFTETAEPEEVLNVARKRRSQPPVDHAATLNRAAPTAPRRISAIVACFAPAGRSCRSGWCSQPGEHLPQHCDFGHLDGDVAVLVTLAPILISLLRKLVSDWFRRLGHCQYSDEITEVLGQRMELEAGTIKVGTRRSAPRQPRRITR